MDANPESYLHVFLDCISCCSSLIRLEYANSSWCLVRSLFIHLLLAWTPFVRILISGIVFFWRLRLSYSYIHMCKRKGKGDPHYATCVHVSCLPRYSLCIVDIFLFYTRSNVSFHVVLSISYFYLIKFYSQLVDTLSLKMPLVILSGVSSTHVV
jgi:hypothetical protein